MTLVRPLSTSTWSFQALGVQIGIQCGDLELLDLIKANWGAFASGTTRMEGLAYRISRDDASRDIFIARGGSAPIAAKGVAEFIHALEQDIILQVQRRRADFYYLHAATAELDGNACLLVAPSGSGKSTTVWALLHHGWSYMSDELAPIDLSARRVHAYPRALCLKQEPPVPYGLPCGTIWTSHTLHVPTASLPNQTNVRSCALAAMFFLEFVPAASSPAVRCITTGEASARLYANALNQLAHPNAGLDAAVQLAQCVPSFRLESAGLGETCELIRSTLADVIGTS